MVLKAFGFSLQRYKNVIMGKIAKMSSFQVHIAVSFISMPWGIFIHLDNEYSLAEVYNKIK